MPPIPCPIAAENASDTPTMAHTPGPWRYFDPIGDAVDSECGPYLQIAAGEGYTLGGNGFGITGYISEADARLIVAAPDLLASCRSLLKYARAGNADREMIDVASVAIARATGQ